MNTDITYYRPKWTCGRYDAISHSALMYNLIAGQTFFFEDESADVIGEVLSVGKSAHILISSIIEKYNIPQDILSAFFSELESYGLVSSSALTESSVRAYRNEVIHNFSCLESSEDGKGILNSSTAESDYANRTNVRVASAMLELTYRCNEQCIHCYNPGASRNETEINSRGEYDELGLDDYKKIIDSLYEEGVARICLSGGDPFTNKYIWSILDYLFSKDIATEIYTNGQAIYGKEEKLASYFPCNVGISIYSVKPEIHDFITRRPGSYKKSFEVLKELSKYSIPLTIKCCLMRVNAKCYRDVALLAREIRANFQIECNIFDSLDGDRCVSSFLRLSEEQLRIILRDPMVPQYVGAEVENYGARKFDMNSSPCGAGKQFVCITPSGNVILCPTFHAIIGNLKHNSLSDVLTKSAALNKWKETQLGSFEECGRHDYCSFCTLCPGLNFAEHGTIVKAAENNCFLAKIRYRLMTDLKEGKDPLNGNDIEENLCSLGDQPYGNPIPVKVQKDNNFDKPL